MYTAGFTTSGDTNCDTYSLSYSLTTSRTNADTTVTTWTDFPQLLSEGGGRHISLTSSDNTYTGTCTTEITADLPDSSSNLSHSVAI